jgi:effector-binding domain-containing protein
MLRLRRADLQTHITEDMARLARVEARLRTIEREGHLADDVVVKPIPAMRVAELTGTAASYAPRPSDRSSSRCTGSWWRVWPAPGSPRPPPTATGRVVPAPGPAVAWYEDAPDGDGAVVVHAALPVPAAAEPREGHDVAIVELPRIEQAASIVHRGAMDHVLPTVQTLARWIEANGYRSVGYARELYIQSPPGELDRWVTELQEPVTPVSP